MGTHSSVLAWRIPGMAEPDGLPSMGSQSWTRLKQLSSSSSSNVSFHTVHGVLKARILNWFATFSSPVGHILSDHFHHDPSTLGGPTQHGLVSLS